MFRGDDPDLGRSVQRALALARASGHPRAGSEHLLLALAAGGGPVAGILASQGASRQALQAAVCAAAPAGAGAASDRQVLATLGIDLDPVLGLSGTAVLDRPAARAPLFPAGSRSARRRCRQLSPPLGLDAQAAYEASLRLALARRERAHRAEHLALALLTVDPGIAWMLASAGVDSLALLASLAARFPPPHRSRLLRAERRLGRRRRQRAIVTRYQNLTGRGAPAGPAVATLITG
jgi:hypothetical protein